MDLKYRKDLVVTVWIDTDRFMLLPLLLDNIIYFSFFIAKILQDPTVSSRLTSQAYFLNMNFLDKPFSNLEVKTTARWASAQDLSCHFG